MFHGAKSEIVGEINVTKSRANNDLGRGFYTGENYQQAVSFVAGFPQSCIYLFDFDKIKMARMEEQYGLSAKQAYKKDKTKRIKGIVSGIPYDGSGTSH